MAMFRSCHWCRGQGKVELTCPGCEGRGSVVMGTLEGAAQGVLDAYSAFLDTGNLEPLRLALTDMQEHLAREKP